MGIGNWGIGRKMEMRLSYFGEHLNFRKNHFFYSARVLYKARERGQQNMTTVNCQLSTVNYLTSLQTLQ